MFTKRSNIERKIIDRINRMNRIRTLVAEAFLISHLDNLLGSVPLRPGINADVRGSDQKTFRKYSFKSAFICVHPGLVVVL